MKIIRVQNNLIVVLSDGTVINNSDCTDDLYNSIINSDDEEFVRDLLLPKFKEAKVEYDTKMDLLNNVSKSNYLSVEGASIYLREVSELSLPEDLAMAIYNAEMAGDEETLSSYINFWTLASMNPDSRARTNLFWFLKKYGMTISKSGLFVAYRNVELKKEGSTINSSLAKFVSDQYFRVKSKLKKSPKNYVVGYQKGLDEDNLIIATDKDKCKKVLGSLDILYNSLGDKQEAPIYTDAHSRSFVIQIGKPVVMDRKKCDPVQENTCSHGLHVAGKSWLEAGYFGKTSLIVLVNPTDVVAVPPKDSYGKMRVCAYYPVAIVERDEEGKIVSDKYPDGFEDDFMDIISYKGTINNEETEKYTLNVPDIPEISKDRIYARLDDIKNQIKNKYNVIK